MARKPLILGAAYHGNRMPHHAREDLHDMSRNGMDLVVHMFSHTDWDRHTEKMKEIIAISHDAGLETWVDNWGLGGPPGDKSHFLAYHPEAHQVLSDSTVDPVRVCLNAPSFRTFMKKWIDTVAYIEGGTIFWDEPHLPSKNTDEGTVYSCACPICREKFRARFGYDMPAVMNEDVQTFRLATINDYFTEMTDYSAAQGLKNAVCVMLGEEHGISLKTLGSLCSVPHLDSIGSDPYWVGHAGVDPYDFVYTNTKKNLEVSEHFGRDHNIWIQLFNNPRGSEEDVVQACEAAYDAGARTILAWGYYGSESNDYAAKNPERAWNALCAGFRRIREMERDAVLEEHRAKYKD